MSDVLDVWLAFADLKAANIVSNWQTLSEWIEKYSFPAGQLLGPNSRRWRQSEVTAWLATRPSGAKRVPLPMKARKKQARKK